MNQIVSEVCIYVHIHALNVTSGRPIITQITLVILITLTTRRTLLTLITLIEVGSKLANVKSRIEVLLSCGQW